eukprot:3554040-Amphidinium_carterae.1
METDMGKMTGDTASSYNANNEITHFSSTHTSNLNKPFRNVFLMCSSTNKEATTQVIQHYGECGQRLHACLLHP